MTPWTPSCRVSCRGNTHQGVASRFASGMPQALPGLVGRAVLCQGGWWPHAGGAGLGWWAHAGSGGGTKTDRMGVDCSWGEGIRNPWGLIEL